MIITKVYNKILYYWGQLKYRFIMNKFGSGSRIIKPMLIANSSNISIGTNVLIRNGVRLEVVGNKPGVIIEIGNNVNIEQYVHIVAKDSIRIGNNVSITGGCSIVDIVHPYDEFPNIPKIGDRISQKTLPVSIGDNTFIGYGVHINPGISIGQNCIIGARSVVTKDIGNYCIVAGNPARIIKFYNFENNVWERV